MLLLAGVSLAQMGEVTFTEGYDAQNHTLTYQIEGPDVTTVSRVVDVSAADEDKPTNHGQVVSSFVHDLKDQGINGAGCLIRIIAQSDYGKASVAPIVQVVPNVHEVSCGKPDQGPEGDIRGNSANQGNDHGNGNSHGNNGHGNGGGDD